MTCELASAEPIRIAPACADLIARLPFEQAGSRARSRRESIGRAWRAVLARLHDLLRPDPVDLLDDYPESERARALGRQFAALHWVNR
ncbi:hypothetical protein SAMN05428970_0083 [Agromyces sp. CF514]|uniref:hypothetical protein n=1 Tax=Agromyces sp. CF514 TaxID=1881031 RepID=UPI0008EBEEB7|nr:hypothetical protein [Agromyces sp. CF514]SFR66707.1 hypothetical protein SAMN05428970_0083 [Agromyces sp. CF514]